MPRVAWRKYYLDEIRPFFQKCRATGQFACCFSPVTINSLHLSHADSIKPQTVDCSLITTLPLQWWGIFVINKHLNIHPIPVQQANGGHKGRVLNALYIACGSIHT